MIKKVIIYFVMSIIVIGCAVVYFISREISPENAVITGEYEIWETEVVTTVVTTTITHTNTTSATEFVYINLNTATIAELVKLDGIGEQKAADIIDYRAAFGKFNNIEEIMNVKGIGRKTFYSIKNHIYVENPVYPTEPTESAEPTEIILVQNEPTECATIQATEQIIAVTEPPVLWFELNNVTYEQLLLIPEIDEQLASNIISLRTTIQYFSHVYELLYAEGMTEEKLVKIKDYFYVINDNSID